MWYLVGNYWVLAVWTAYVILACVGDFAPDRHAANLIKRSLGAFLASSAWYPIAAVSYPAYLLQNIAHLMLAPTSGAATTAAQCYGKLALVAAGATALGAYAAVLVERPAMALGRALEPSALACLSAAKTPHSEGDPRKPGPTVAAQDATGVSSEDASAAIARSRLRQAVILACLVAAAAAVVLRARAVYAIHTASLQS